MPYWHIVMNSEHTDLDKMIGIPVVAECLDVSVRTVWRLIREEELPKPVKVGRCTRMYLSDLKDYMERLKKQRD